jgi:hypothetical protein
MPQSSLSSIGSQLSSFANKDFGSIYLMRDLAVIECDSARLIFEFEGQ